MHHLHVRQPSRGVCREGGRNMKSIAYVLVAGVLACGAPDARAEETNNRAAPRPIESSEPYMNIGVLETAVERHGFGSTVSGKRESESLLEILGLAGRGPYPLRGGPFD
jgi:hypothetical protein